VECLEYQEPRGGEDLPADTTAADSVHWQIRLAVADLDRLRAGLAEREPLPREPVVLEPQTAALLGFRRALPLRDPDGHALQLVES
jgi:hypothetical protein